ncbi:2-oxo acid dehydrogenase subunit E2 [Romboutsia sp.]|uniref:2-oxo acid dehydrogenase subunit E2 n=1 Tax=Romboutsia sp. TaxID=1965302 RepID=UPI003F3B77AE
MGEGKRIKENYKISGARKFIATKMKESLRDYPQGTGSSEISVDKVLELKNELKKQNSNVSMTSIFVKLVAEALKKHPVMNSALIEDEFFIYESINIGVGIGLDDGIMMVVVKEAQNKDIFQISDELQTMISKLKAKKLPFDCMMDSTFTVSNMGMLGFEQVTPFLNPPETGILGIGTTKKKYVIDNNDVATISNMACFNITVNHAAIDGLHGGLFLLTLKDILADPKSYVGL